MKWLELTDEQQHLLDTGAAAPGAKYLRISDDREGRELGVTRQEQDLDAIAPHKGVVWVAQYCDNDISASGKAKKERPDYKRMITHAKEGRFTVIGAYTSARLTRRPMEHEGQLDLAENYGIRYVYKQSPEYDLNTAGGRMVARVLAAKDASDSETISELVKRQRRQAAEQGRVQALGRRPFGFESDGLTPIPAEYEEIRSWGRKLLKGVSLRELTADLRARGVPSSTGSPWRPPTLRQILLRPRSIGQTVYLGKPMGVLRYPDTERYRQAGCAGELVEPIFTPEQHEAIVAHLNNPARRTNPGPAPKWLLSGIALCGMCLMEREVGMRCMYTSGNRRGRRRRLYGCPERHLYRDAEALERYIITLTIKLARTNPNVLVPERRNVDVAALRIKDEALENLLKQIDGDADTIVVVDGAAVPLIDHATWRRRRENVLVQRREIAVELAHTLEDSPYKDLALARNEDVARQMWDAMDLGSRRAAVRALMRIVVRPAHGDVAFDEDKIEVTPVAKMTG